MVDMDAQAPSVHAACSGKADAKNVEPALDLRKAATYDGLLQLKDEKYKYLSLNRSAWPRKGSFRRRHRVEGAPFAAQNAPRSTNGPNPTLDPMFSKVRSTVSCVLGVEEPPTPPSVTCGSGAAAATANRAMRARAIYLPAPHIIFRASCFP